MPSSSAPNPPAKGLGVCWKGHSLENSTCAVRSSNAFSPGLVPERERRRTFHSNRERGGSHEQQRCYPIPEFKLQTLATVLPRDLARREACKVGGRGERHRKRRHTRRESAP